MSSGYKRKRPNVAIFFVKEANLGNCYNAYYYKIVTNNRMSRKTIVSLRELGLLGSGQEFKITSQCDGEEEPAGFDTVECINSDGTPAENYLGVPVEPREEPYYVYHIMNRIDSSD